MCTMRSAVPKRYAEATLAAFDTSGPGAARAAQAAHRLLDGEIDSLALIGPFGVGKTYLAAAIFREIEAAQYAQFLIAREAWILEAWKPQPRDVPPEWCNVPALIQQLRAEMGTRDRSAFERIQMLGSCRSLVVLDDLGREKISDWAGEAIYTLINGRYERMLATIVTSNLKVEDLIEAGYGAVISRLAEDGVLCELTGRDRRLAG
jgi:DNA replication protein DnaC